MTFETVYEKTLTGDSNGWNGQTRVQLIPAATVGAANKMRLTFAGASTKPLGILSMYVGERGSNNVSFASTPVQVKVSGNGSFDIPQNGTLVTDEIDIDFSGTKDLLIAASYTTDTAKNDMRVLFGSGVNASYFWKNNVNEASSISKSGYDSAGNNPNALGSLCKIEVIRPEVEEPEIHPLGFYETPAGVDARLIERIYAPTYNLNSPRNFQRIVHLAIPDCEPGDVITAFSSWAYTLPNIFNINTEVSCGLILTPDPTGIAGVQDIPGDQFCISCGEQPSNGKFVSRLPGRNLTANIHHDFQEPSGHVEVPEGMSGTLYLAIIGYADASDPEKYIEVEPHSCRISAKVDKAN